MKKFNLQLENASRDDLLLKIKEQEQIIHSLKKIENNYNDLLDESLDGIYRSTLEGKFVEVNNSLVNMLGYNSKEELLNIDIKSELYFDISDRDQEFSIHERTLKKSEIYRLRKKDGSEIWVEDYGRNIFDKNGEILYYEGILRDVSEKKRQDDVLNVLLNISKRGYSAIDLKEFVEFIKLELGKLLDTKNFYIAFYNKERDTINIPFISGEESEEEFPAEKSMTAHLINNKKPILIYSEGIQQLLDDGVIRKIGSLAKVWMGVPLKVENEVMGAIVVQSYEDEQAYEQEDIELLEFVSSHISQAIQRAKNHHETVVSKQILKKILNNIPINVFWKDTESKYLGSNFKSLKEMGVDDEKAVIGKSDFDFFNVDDAKKYHADEVVIMQTGKPKLNYQETKLVDGKNRYFLSNKLPFFDENKNVIGIVGTSEDITERKEIQMALEKLSDELKLQNETKDKFFSIISHDLINPLSGIIGFSDLLKNNPSELESHKIALYAGIINDSANYTLGLLRNLLEWSRVQTGSISTVMEEINLEDLIKHNISGIKTQASAKNIQLNTIFRTTLPVYGDRKMISTVIRNLLSNAIKFTPQGGSVSMATNEKTIDGKKFIETVISDTGVGIEKENLKKLFKIEQNYKSVGTNKETGTGLGLILCKEFIEKNNGKIKAKSTPNVGSSFIFTLPVV